LEETYGRCIERINRKDSRVLKVLKWVSFATIPLHVEELREAVAFDLGDTAWNAEKMPQKEFVIGCCANLVVVDSTDNRVRFAHSSVKQYLEKGRERNIIQGYPTTAQGVLECGEFCVAYLSFSDFSLQLSTRRNEKAVVAVPPPFLLAQETLPGLFTRRLFQKPRNQKRSVSVPFRTVTAPTPDRNRYKFLDYAVTNWALQTKKIPHTSLMWERFEGLATCFNETWNFHPWVSGGRSESSRLHSIFGWAVKEQHEPLLSIARAAGPNLLRVCNVPVIGEGLPALHIASKLGYETMVRSLLGFCNANVLDLQGYTALHHTASRGHIKICQLLLSAQGIKVNAPSNSQQTALSQAARNGHNAVVKLLLGIGAEFDSQDVDSRTPLLWAARNGHEAVVKLLIEKGANLEAKDEWGRTPLSWAARNGHEAVVKLLLDKGANFEARDKISGRTPLLWAARIGHEAVVKLLIEKCADLEANEGWGQRQTPLSCAAMNGHEAVVKLLIDNDANLEFKDEQGRTPLLWAAINGHEAVVKLLIEKGANLEAKDKLGPTSLSWAAIKRHEAVVKLLIEKGADPSSA
jgi:ankyrin repeat protein